MSKFKIPLSIKYVYNNGNHGRFVTEIRIVQVDFFFTDFLLVSPFFLLRGDL